MKIWERKKKGVISHLEIAIKAYFQKTFPFLAKEPDETMCVPHLSRYIFHKEYSGSWALMKPAIPGIHRERFLKGFALARIKGFQTGNSCWDSVAGSVVKTAVSLGNTVSRMANCSLSLSAPLPQFQAQSQFTTEGDMQGVKELQEFCKGEDFDSGPLEGQEVSGRLCILMRHFPND